MEYYFMAESILSRVVRRVQQAEAEWRGGLTHAIYAFPPSALMTPAAAELWVGTAEIQSDAPYSNFAGQYRIHMPIKGAGIHLQFEQPRASQTLSAFQQISFDGGRPLYVSLLDGAVSAFNLIAQRHVSSSLIALELDEESYAWDRLGFEALPPNLHRVQVLYVCQGQLGLRAAGKSDLVLHEGDAFVLEYGPNASGLHLPWRLSAYDQRAQIVLASLGW
jgi:environmental stress-induced protein Ves